MSRRSADKSGLELGDVRIFRGIDDLRRGRNGMIDGIFEDFVTAVRYVRKRASRDGVN